MRLFIFGALVVLAAPSALAQKPLLDRAEACAGIDDAGQRHACFDALVPELKKSGEAKFGAPAPKASALTAPVVAADAPKPAAAPPQADKVSLAVKAITAGADGKMRFAMENGQVWKQLDPEKLRVSAQGPWTADIRAASLGSYLLTINGGRSVRVQRVN